MTAPEGAREPCRIARPPSPSTGLSSGRMTSSLKTSAPSRFERTVRPDTVITSCSESRDISARNPPASKKSSIRYSPDGRMFASTGTERANASKRSKDSGTPARPAMAIRWITAFVEPPNAKTTETALSNEAEDNNREGEASDPTRDTIARPDAAAMRAWPESAAGIEEAPGNDRPNASTAAVIVDAVPIVMQWPGDRAMDASISSSSDSDKEPARRSAQNRQTSEPDPSTWPRQYARSIGPAGTNTNGRSVLNAPITSPGVVLSQPPISTAPSITDLDRKS